LQPILPGGAEEADFPLYTSPQNRETHAVLYFGRAGLKPALFAENASVSASADGRPLASSRLFPRY
jgi:hypothetical protein